jgi:hypothetical protein
MTLTYFWKNFFAISQSINLRLLLFAYEKIETFDTLVFFAVPQQFVNLLKEDLQEFTDQYSTQTSVSWTVKTPSK